MHTSSRSESELTRLVDNPDKLAKEKMVQLQNQITSDNEENGRGNNPEGSKDLYIPDLNNTPMSEAIKTDMELWSFKME